MHRALCFAALLLSLSFLKIALASPLDYATLHYAPDRAISFVTPPKGSHTHSAQLATAVSAQSPLTARHCVLLLPAYVAPCAPHRVLLLPATWHLPWLLLR